jgi:hypothetical protein
MTKVLFITSKGEDYLQDSLLHGFRSLLGNSLTEYPLKPQMYDDFGSTEHLYGRGFTLYGSLPAQSKRSVDNIVGQIHKYDLVIFSSIHRQFEDFYNTIGELNENKTILIDGEDHPYLFPLFAKWRSDKRVRSTLRIIRKCIYFKREQNPHTLSGLWYKFPIINRMTLVPKKNIKTISFSIPKEKVINRSTTKKKEFPAHIVDDQISDANGINCNGYIFNKESDYYADLQSSKYGITTKRSGWDCMRHYEIAANNTVICFKNLTSKWDCSAPHGLNTTNCVIYNNYNDLQLKIACIDERKYDSLLKESKKWILNNTTVKRAKEVLESMDLQ